VPFPDWVINAGVIVAGMSVGYGGLRAVVIDLKHRLDSIQSIANETASRLVALETRLEALDALRFDERLRSLELALARNEGLLGSRGSS
jgi:hypothetical protein